MWLAVDLGSDKFTLLIYQWFSSDSAYSWFRPVPAVSSSSTMTLIQYTPSTRMPFSSPPKLNRRTSEIVHHSPQTKSTARPPTQSDRDGKGTVLLFLKRSHSFSTRSYYTKPHRPRVRTKTTSSAWVLSFQKNSLSRYSSRSSSSIGLFDISKPPTRHDKDSYMVQTVLKNE